MKVFLVVLLFVVVVTAQKKRCKTAQDCDETECCVLSNFFSGKGRCKPLAKENDRCSRPEDKLPVFDKFLGKCPCESGLVCNAEKVVKSKFLNDVEVRINERCAKENEVTTGEEVATEEVATEETVEAE